MQVKIFQITCMSNFSQVGFLICDPTVEKPDLLKDKFWDQVIPDQLPYTKYDSQSPPGHD